MNDLTKQLFEAIDSGQNTNCQALLYASQVLTKSTDANISRLAIKHNEVNAFKNFIGTPLAYAAHKGHLSWLTTLLPFSNQANLQLALWEAAGNNQKAIMAFIFANYEVKLDFKITEIMPAISTSHHTPFQNALKNKRPDALSFLIVEGAKPTKADVAWAKNPPVATSSSFGGSAVGNTPSATIGVFYAGGGTPTTATPMGFGAPSTTATTTAPTTTTGFGGFGGFGSGAPTNATPSSTTGTMGGGSQTQATSASQNACYTITLWGYRLAKAEVAFQASKPHSAAKHLAKALSKKPTETLDWLAKLAEKSTLANQQVNPSFVKFAAKTVKGLINFDEKLEKKFHDEITLKLFTHNPPDSKFFSSQQEKTRFFNPPAWTQFDGENIDQASYQFKR